MTTAPATSSSRPSMPAKASPRSATCPAGPVTLTVRPSGAFASLSRRVSTVSAGSSEEDTGTKTSRRRSADGIGGETASPNPGVPASPEVVDSGTAGRRASSRWPLGNHDGGDLVGVLVGEQLLHLRRLRRRGEERPVVVARDARELAGERAGDAADDQPPQQQECRDQPAQLGVGRGRETVLSGMGSSFHVVAPESVEGPEDGRMHRIRRPWRGGWDRVDHVTRIA